MLTGKEVWLLQIQTLRGNSTSSGSTISKKELNAWRCDPHPSWSRDYRWITFNGRPEGGLVSLMMSTSARICGDTASLPPPSPSP